MATRALRPVRKLGEIARLEFVLMGRDYWFAGFTFVFSALLLSVAWFGYAGSGMTGVQTFSRTSISLLNLVLYLVPLVGLFAGVQSLTQADRAGEQIFSQPVSRTTVLAGKFFGEVAWLWVAMLIAFSLTGALIAYQVGTSGVADFGLLAGVSLLLGASSVALGMLVAALTGRSLASYGVALFVWFLVVYLFDLTVLGMSNLLVTETANKLLLGSIFLNPVDAARVSVLTLLQGKEIFGLAGEELAKRLGGINRAIALQILALVVWTAVPAWLTGLLLKRSDIG